MFVCTSAYTRMYACVYARMRAVGSVVIAVVIIGTTIRKIEAGC